MATTISSNMFLDIVFIVDATASMSAEIEAMKTMITEFARSAGSDTSLRIHVWSFMESAELGCFVSKSNPKFSPNELVDYVKTIKMFHPPDYPHLSVYDYDYAQNVTASVSSLLDSFTERDNILSFIITDDLPHHRAFGQSGEALQELKWLQKQDPNLPTDIFQRLNVVIERLNVTFVPILIKTSSAFVWYHQAAVLTNGVSLLMKGSRDSKALADGLVTLMRAMQGAIVERRVDRDQVQSAVDVCARVFNVMTPGDDWVPFEDDPLTLVELRRECGVASDPYEVQASFLGLIQTAVDLFSGKKSEKRCRTVEPKLVAAAVRVFVLAMLVQTGLASQSQREELEKAGEEMKSHLERNVETGRREIWYLNSLLTRISAAEKITPSTTEVQCIITLESAWDTLSGLEQLPSTEKDVKTWMEIVLQLSLCRLLEVQYPLGANGRPDFMDAWSANITGFSWGTILSAYAAVKLRDDSDNGTYYLDPTSREIFNSALLLAHPDDSVLSACFTTLSALPSLQGLVQGYLTSGGLKIFPSLTPGLHASSLIAQLRKIALREDGVVKEVEHEWLRSMVWSLRIAAVKPAFDVLKSLKSESGQLNPVDNVSKLMAAFVGYMNPETVVDGELKKRWKFLFEELATDTVSAVIKWGWENRIPSDTDIIKCFIQEPDEYEPCKELHPAETFDSEKTVKEKKPMQQLRDLAGRCAAFSTTMRMMKVFWRHVDGDGKEFLLTEEEMLTTFTESLILRKRTARYNLDPDSKTWTRMETVGIAKKLDELLKNVFSARFGKWNTARQEYAHAMLMRRTVKFSGKTETDCNEFLRKLRYTLLGHGYRFRRKHVPEILAAIKTSRIPTMGAAAVRGDWCPEPPSELRRLAAGINRYFSGELSREIEKVLSANPRCHRKTRPNRHGHTESNPFPGFTNWSQEYHDERLKTMPSKKGRLEAMKEYHEFLQKARVEVVKMEHGAMRELVEVILVLPGRRDDMQRCIAAYHTVHQKWRDGEGAEVEEKAPELLDALSKVRHRMHVVDRVAAL